MSRGSWARSLSDVLASVADGLEETEGEEGDEEETVDDHDAYPLAHAALFTPIQRAVIALEESVEKLEGSLTRQAVVSRVREIMSREMKAVVAAEVKKAILIHINPRNILAEVDRLRRLVESNQAAKTPEVQKLTRASEGLKHLVDDLTVHANDLTNRVAALEEHTSAPA